MKNKLNALLLSAGYGTRLRPLTLKTPKCLVEINGQPLLDHWLTNLNGLGVSKTLINTHYLNSKVDDFLSNRSYGDMSVETIYEHTLLGTAGTLIENKEFFEFSTGLLIHSDNFSYVNLSDFVDAHYRRPPKCLLTMLTFKTFNPVSCGIVETDNDGVVTSYHEKVGNPPTDIANGAIYVFDLPFVEWLIKNHSNASDFSTEILPKLVGRIYTWHTYQPYIDIGTPEALKQAIALSKEKNLGIS